MWFQDKTKSFLAGQRRKSQAHKTSPSFPLREPKRLLRDSTDLACLQNQPFLINCRILFHTFHCTWGKECHSHMVVDKTRIGLHLFIPSNSIPYLLSFSELQGLIQSSPIQVLLTPFSHWAIINSVYSAQVDQATGPQGSWLNHNPWVSRPGYHCMEVCIIFLACLPERKPF